MSSELTPDLCDRVRAIFAKNKWPKPDAVGGGEISNFYDTYCQMLTSLSDEERHLIMDLSDDFLFRPVFYYEHLIQEALSKISPDRFAERRIFFLPLTLGHKNKSGNMVSYLARVLASKLSGFSKFRIQDPPNLMQFGMNYSNRTDSLVAFFDDFIGSGLTAKGVLKRFNLLYRVPTDDVIVVSLVVQKKALRVISAQGADVFYAIDRDKGISHNARIRDKQAAVHLMKRIEKRLGVPQRYSLGFKQTQALVGMQATPNNTFPVFWWPEDRNGDARPAPFPRSI